MNSFPRKDVSTHTTLKKMTQKTRSGSCHSRPRVHLSIKPGGSTHVSYYKSKEDKSVPTQLPRTPPPPHPSPPSLTIYFFLYLISLPILSTAEPEKKNRKTKKKKI
ncbi:hypothetical protein ACOSQ2_007748 [Xanthoceras sorbifolium]